MSKPEPNDSRLIELIRDGDRQAFETLVARHRSRMFGLALRFVKDQGDAEEIVQEVLLTIHQKLAMFKGKSQFSTWLYRIVVNSALMRIRSASHPELVPLDAISESFLSDSDGGLPPDEHLISEQSLMEIEKVVGYLPDEFKTIVILRDIEGFSNEETAEIMEITTAAVKSRLHRARGFLRIKLEDLYKETVKS